MSDRTLSMGDGEADDLPRTFRREREARERAALEAEPVDIEPTAPEWVYQPAPQPAIVRAIDVPFFSLMLFFMKAVVAAIPALILLTLILFAGGQVLKNVYPELRLFEVEIRPVSSMLDSPLPPRPVPARRAE